jgi:hypothetical protein
MVPAFGQVDRHARAALDGAEKVPAGGTEFAASGGELAHRAQAGLGFDRPRS